MKKNKILILTMICLLALALITGCGEEPAGEPIDESKIETPEEILMQSAEAMKDVGNYNADMDMEMLLNVEGEEIAMPTKMDMSVFQSPIKIRMNTLIEMPAELGGTIKQQAYVMHEGESLVTYVAMSGSWAKMTQPFSAELLTKFSRNYSEIYSKSLKGAEIVSEEQVKGVDCWKIDTTISPEASLDLIAQTAQNGQELIDTATADQIAAMGDMKATIWVAKDSYYQMRIYMDMSQNMAALVPAEQGIEITKVVMDMTCYDYNKAEPFELPEGAKDAIEQAIQ